MKASMPTEKIRLKDEVYEITLMKGRDAFELTRKLGIKLSGVFSTMASAYVLGNPESLSSNLQGNIQDILGDDLLDLFDDVISPYTLKCNNDLIDDIDVHFAGRPLVMYELLVRAILVNCGDFTHLLDFFKNKMETLKVEEEALKTSSKNPEKEELQEMIQTPKRRPRK